MNYKRKSRHRFFCLCDRGLHQYLRNLVGGGGGVWTLQTSPLGTPLIPCILSLLFYSRAGWFGGKAVDFYREALVRISDETRAVLSCFSSVPDGDFLVMSSLRYGLFLIIFNSPLINPTLWHWQSLIINHPRIFHYFSIDRKACLEKSKENLHIILWYLNRK